MKYRLPEECLALSHAGRTIAVAAGGTVEFDASVAAELATHGLVPVPDAPATADPDTSGKRPATR